MTVRFHAPDADHPGQTIDLPDDEAVHLARVLRLSAGAPIRIFNGRGGEFDAVVDTIARSCVQVRVTASRTPAAEARVAVTLAQAVLKGDRMDDVVRDAVMMGVAAIQPVIASRTEVPPGALQRGVRRARWERIAVSSAKQCGRATVPPVLAPCTFPDVCGAIIDAALPSPALMLAEPSASAGAAPLRELQRVPPAEATVAIGPEGGWTPEEIRRGSDAFRLVTLGSRTIRADAMAVVAIAALFAVWHEF